MSNYAYMRVSMGKQDVDNQRHGILDYCNQRQLLPVSFVEDAVSGKVDWRKRKLGAMLGDTVGQGDNLIFAEMSRMGRSLLQILSIAEECTKKGIIIHIVKQGIVFDGSGDSLQSTALLMGLGFAAQAERHLISQRTKEALAKRKAQGQKLGRPKGSKSRKVKLDDFEQEIRGYLAKGINKRAIAKLIDCSPSTLYSWLERKDIRVRKHKKFEI